MADREKILHELDHQVADADWCDNDWKDNVPIWMLRGALDILREQDTVEHALDVLRAHGWKDSGEAVKPKPTGVEPNYNCGKCGLPIQQGYPFCPWCGKAVKWDDAE